MLYGDIYKAAGMKDSIIMGDFNRRGINCETFVTDGHGEILLDLRHSLFLTQHVLEKTRKESALDLVFSSEPGMMDDLEVREEFREGNEHQSDHRVILFQMNLKPVTILDNYESYNYNEEYFSAMIIFMRGVNWKDGLYGENMERSWHMITNIVDQFCSKDEKKTEKETFMDGTEPKRQNTKVMTNRKGNHLMRIGKTITRH